MKTIVITGSSRGIGLGLAREFLARNCKVVVSGSTPTSTTAALAQLANFDQTAILGQPCNVTDFAQVQHLWDASVAHFGQVDIWINNAGINNSVQPFWEESPEKLARIVATNILGAQYGSKVALAGMIAQGFGQLYNMEGFGSDGRKMFGMAPYGASKYALRYLNRALADEVKDKPVQVGALSPGMTLTDMITGEMKDPHQEARLKWVMNTLGDRVETVTPWLAERVLANNKNGTRIAWLTQSKIITRFMLSRFRKRDIFNV